jgi:hypothetical protein
MRLFEFVPIYDQTYEDDSLIERVFGPEFCVVDETGHLLTTTHNQNLLLRVKALMAQHQAIERSTLMESLARLRGKAEVVAQRDYDLAVSREIRDCDSGDQGFDLSLQAGGLL